MTVRPRLTGLVVVVLAAIITGSQLLELFVNRVLRPDLQEWTWISEIFVIAALLVVTAMWGRLRLARTAIAILERQRLAAQAELAVAARVQRALLPPIPRPMHGVVWHAVMEPAGQVGGDYYDFFLLNDDRMCVVLADVSGKGVPAAVFVSNTRAVLRAVAREHSTLSGLLAAVSEILLMDGGGELYVTCFIAAVDAARHTMVYANAGHPSGVILDSRGNRRVLDVGGPPLGLFRAAHYNEERIALDPGDLVVMVSDGITDAIDAGGEAIPSAIGAELAMLREKTPEAACAALLDRARGSLGPQGVASWSDDRTVVAFAFVPDVCPFH